MNYRLHLLALVAAVIGMQAAHALPVAAEHIEAELVAEKAAWVPGQANGVALRLAPERGWHTYWLNPGDSGTATSLKWTLPESWEAGDIQWPFPEAQRIGELVNYGYSRETLHLVEMQVPAGASGNATVRALARWLVCADVCIPGQAELELSLPVATAADPDPGWAALFAETRDRLPREPALSATFAIADRELRLQIATSVAADDAQFFPVAGDVVDHGAAQRVASSADGIAIAQPLNAAFSEAPTAIDGVLVSGGKGYAVHAEAGAAVAFPAEPALAVAASSTAGPGFLVALTFALLGGLILNLMPCVFPVLSIKAVSVLESRRGEPAAERAHALAYTAGVIVCCLALAGLLLILRATGTAVGWGFQLQSTPFVAALAYLMFALGLSLSGVVQLGTRFMGVGQALAERGGYAGSFFTGLLAVVVASPCTVPFMGTAVGYAMTQGVFTALAVFAALGLGLASPFLLLGLFPRLGAFLPRPGRWMETFKQLMAFPLYLTAVWLVWIVARQTGADATGLVLLGLVLLGAAAWLAGRATTGPAGRAMALGLTVLALAVLAHPALRAAPSPDATPAPRTASGQEPYTDARLAQLRAAGRTVFVNFTADWCITCKVNERVALDTDAVQAAFAQRNVAWLVADWTQPDPAITAALARFGRSGVPLYLLYPPQGEPEILPQILTPQLVVEAVQRLPAAP